MSVATIQGPYPDGTSVSAYLGRKDDESIPPTWPAVETQTASGGYVTFTTLIAGAEYTAVGTVSGVRRWVSFTVPYLRGTGNVFAVTSYPATGGDDASSFNAAASAAVAAGSGRIYAPANAYTASARIVIPNYCTLEGDGPGQGIKTKPIPTRIVCAAVGSGVTVQGRGGESRDFKIFGDGVANNPLLIDVVPAGDVGTQRGFRNIDVDGALQDNAVVYTPQNMRFWNFNLSAAGRDNLVLDKGSAGHIFSGCEITSAGRYGVYVTETGHTGGASKPGHVTFIGCIFELNALAAVRAEFAANTLRFIDCSFAVAAGAGPLVRIDEATAGDITNPLVFENCSWYMVGTATGPAAIQVNSPDNGTVKVVLAGQHYFQGTGSTPFIDSPNAVVLDNGHVTLLNATYKTTGSRVRSEHASDLVAPGIVLSSRTFVPAGTTTKVLGSDDSYVGVDTSGGAVNVELPDLAELATQGKTGKIIEVKDETGNAHTNNITVKRVASATGVQQQIDAANSYVMSTDRGFLRVRALANAWEVVGRSYFLADHIADLAGIYAMLKDVSASITTAATAGAEYLLAPNQTNLVVSTTSAGGGPAASAKRRLKAADYTPPSPLATKLKLACTVSPANGNPNATFTFNLKPVSTTTGNLVVGATVATVAITPSSGNADFENESADFAFPTDGEYVVTCVPSAIPAVNCGVSAKIQRHAV